jgi:hypothetical protein
MAQYAITISHPRASTLTVTENATPTNSLPLWTLANERDVALTGHSSAAKVKATLAAAQQDPVQAVAGAICMLRR